MKIGLVIADESEYIMLRKKAENEGAERVDFYTREGHIFKLGDNIEVHSVLCGVGTVNACAAATFLVMNGCKAVLSFGLSGGISGISKNEFMVGTEYIEHDFDLTPLGYRPCEKPLQDYIYKGDQRLIEKFQASYPFIKKGVVVSGDSFICDNSKRDFFKVNHHAMSCDMESAAVAYVCSLAGVPFVSLRKISDDAGDDASDNYNSALDIDGEEVLSILFTVIRESAPFLS